MRAELEKLNSGLDAMSREELILSIRRLMEECSEKDAQLEINSAASTEMSVQYQQIRDENAALKKREPGTPAPEPEAHGRAPEDEK